MTDDIILSTGRAIGISGFAGSGKTTVANHIQAKYGFRRQHVAEPLRDMLRILLQRNGVADDMINRYLTGDLKEQVIPEIGCTSRHLQITLGTEWGREMIRPDLWSQTWQRMALDGGRVCNDSVRFEDEQTAVREIGGFTMLIVRAGTKPIAYKWGAFGRWLYRRFGLMWGVHDSERVDRLDPDVVIQNAGTIDDLLAEVDKVLSDLLILAQP